MNDAERNKLIARMMKEGASDDQIRAALAREDSLMGWFRRTTAKGQDFENSLKKPTKPSTPSPTMDRLKNVALGGLQKVSGALETGAEYAKNRKDNPIDSIKSGTFTQDMLGAGYNVGKVGLNALDRVMGPVTALDSGVGEVLKESNPLKTPYAFAKGYAQNALKPSSEQSTVSEATGATGMSGLVQDFMVPSTFLGGGFLKALKGGQKLTQAAKAGAKNIGKATLMGGAAARAMSEADDPGAAVPLAVAGAIRGIKGKRPNLEGFDNPAFVDIINEVLDKNPRVASTIDKIITLPSQDRQMGIRGLNGLAVPGTSNNNESFVEKMRDPNWRPDGTDQFTTIRINSNRTPDEFRNTLVHELTHAAQNAFRGGKRPKNANNPLQDISADMAREVTAQSSALPYAVQPIELGARATSHKRDFARKWKERGMKGRPPLNYRDALENQLSGGGQYTKDDLIGPYATQNKSAFAYSDEIERLKRFIQDQEKTTYDNANDDVFEIIKDLRKFSHKQIDEVVDNKLDNDYVLERYKNMGFGSGAKRTNTRPKHGMK